MLCCSTLSADAKSCGAPTGKLQFVAEGWFIGAEALSCDAFYDPSALLGPAGRRRLARAAAEPVTPQFFQADDPSEGASEDGGLVSAVAWVFQGKIQLVKNRDGYQEGRGTVRFVASFGQAPDGSHTTRNSGRRLMAEEAPKAAAPAAGSPAPAAAAAPAKATDSKAPAASPAAAKATDTKAPAAAAAPVATVSGAQAPAAAQAVTPAPASVQGGYEPDYGSSYSDYDGSDLPIVKGGSLSITLYDSYYDDKDDYKY